MYLTSRLITCFIDGFTFTMNSQSIAYILSGSAHIYWIFWTFKVKCPQYEICEQAGFKNARALHFFSRGKQQYLVEFQKQL